MTHGTINIKGKKEDYPELHGMSVWVTIVALVLLPTPFCCAKNQPIAHYNKRHQYSRKEPVNVRFTSPVCPGFSIGLSPKVSDVVKDGRVAPSFAANSDASVENIVGSEVVYRGTLAIQRTFVSKCLPTCTK